jgi:uncharacterized protein (DUF433 family)
MVLQMSGETAPIHIDDGGTARVWNTRVTLETVIAAFHRGDSPEQIVDSFDVLSLADVYAVIAYYLNHREDVDAYIREQYEAAGQLRNEMETHHPELFSLRNRLLNIKQQRRV